MNNENWNLLVTGKATLVFSYTWDSYTKPIFNPSILDKDKLIRFDETVTSDVAYIDYSVNRKRKPKPDFFLSYNDGKDSL